jgi:PhzF family phenazine biosynthesis protein
MKIDIFQIDAFTSTLFGGNPAAVCPLEHWLEDSVLQKIAAENNLAETAFFVKLSEGRFHLKWFTPQHEMDLCGHATLASAFVIFNELGYTGSEITFESNSGDLSVEKEGDLFVLDFPSRPPEKSTLPNIISDSLNILPKEVLKSRDYVLVYDSEEDILNIQPDVSLLNQINLDPGGIIVTAQGKNPNIDFISRFFTPQAVVFEDPVTGSAHCSLIPFWSERLKKTKLEALQLSERRGALSCELIGDRVKIKGKAVKYLQGEINI